MPVRMASPESSLNVLITLVPHLISWPPELSPLGLGPTALLFGDVVLNAFAQDPAHEVLKPVGVVFALVCRQTGVLDGEDVNVVQY